MDKCFYCGDTMWNSERYAIRTKDTRFQGRKRYQIVGFCCIACEDDGKPTQYSTEEWRKVRDSRITCKTHPDAPHGFCRTDSHTEGRYVCECEHWEPTEDHTQPSGGKEE